MLQGIANVNYNKQYGKNIYNATKIGIDKI